MENSLTCNGLLASYGSCRWSTNISEPSLFVNYLGFNIIDLEKNVVALKNPNSVPIADAQTSISKYFTFLLIPARPYYVDGCLPKQWKFGGFWRL